MHDRQTIIYNPLNYICGDGVLSFVGKYAAELGHKALVIGTPESFKAAGETIRKELAKSGVSFEESIFCGYPTKKKAEEYAAEVKKQGAEFLIAVGGGRVLDTAKYAAALSRKKIITIPTISATSAAYRRNSMIYTETGAYIGRVPNQQSPVYVLADACILAQQPVRYLKAGVLDTLVRWYEAKPYAQFYASRLHFCFASGVSKELYDYFGRERVSLLEAFNEGKASETVMEAVTGIIAVCGVAANYEAGVALKGFAHPFYNQTTRIRNSSELLHGEIIGYGILVQLLLEGEGIAVFNKEKARLQEYGFDYSLEEIGIDTEERLNILADSLWKENLPAIPFLQHVKSSEKIKEAIRKVNETVLQRRGGQ